MPKRNDIKRILIIGSGPIIIGQACEFDYSGTQACKALREEGYEVVLINSNPATIMTDPDFSDKTYIEPITPEIIEKIIDKEKPDAILPTLGGQTALNTSVVLAERGVLDKYRIKLIGANLSAIKKAENREEFRDAMERIGLKVPRSGYIKSLKEGLKIIKDIGYPVIIRPSFTLGGTGGSVAYNREEFEEYVEWGINISPVGEVLIEESVLGWKEYELEVMRDGKDNVVIICSIENFDPMGIHTGDSITVAPAQTLSDKEYQIMRDAAIAIIREIGVDTGGSNIQFAVNPDNGELVVIEMNPRVSRSSALASKATGFPIAKIAAKLAIGYTLDEIPNDITRETKASFEPTLDYVVVKIPRFTFEKFPQSDPTLTTQMKSVGEAMAIGRTFKEALQKGLRSLEIGSFGFEIKSSDINLIKEKLRIPNPDRLWYIADAIRIGTSIEEIYSLTKIDKWFLYNIKEIVDMERGIISNRYIFPSYELLKEAKEFGFSDVRIAQLTGNDEMKIRRLRESMGIIPTYKRVDTCAAEFEAYTPYLYSTYEVEDEARVTDRKKVVILGSGPNRIGQGIEFDYCCVHSSFALREEGFETIMVNCNPETVSTDYDTSDRLYFEPLTLEDVLNIIDKEKPYGVILQFGGQTPLKLAISLEKEGVNILGTTSDSIDRAEDRERFKDLLNKLNLKQPKNGIARSYEEALKVGEIIGYPVLVRPSYVLGGRAMEVIYDREGLREYIENAVKASPDHPILIEKFLEDAIEIDVDAISDGYDVVIGGIMEHIERAGIHSGDSACSLPPYSLDRGLLNEIVEQTKALSYELEVVGLMNIQYAIKDKEIYILEVNPRASRTIPFVSKAIGIPLAKIATKIMVGKRLKDLGFTKEVIPEYISVKESVFPFIKFPGVDTILGPEMKSTGEVMGIDKSFEMAFAKSQIATGLGLPLEGNVFISVRDEDKEAVLPVAERLLKNGFNIFATRGTASFLRDNKISVRTVNKVQEGSPNIVDIIKSGEVSLVINTPSGTKSLADSYSIRRTTIHCNIPYFTTISGAMAAVRSIESIKNMGIDVNPLQYYHRRGN
jgi:carbamoyl-phosphate synthase large subunit